MSLDELKTKIRTYLKNHDTMVLATVAAGGRPQAAPVFYCEIGFDLYFMSDPDSDHCLNLARNPWAAATVTDDGQNWTEIQGLQLEGMAGQVADPILKARAMTSYLAKFPFAAPLLVKNSGAFQKTGKARLYRFRPGRISMTDNRVAFGHREEFLLNESEEGI